MLTRLSIFFCRLFSRRKRGRDVRPFLEMPASSNVVTSPITVHMLWVYGSLSKLERLSCASFVANKYRVILWTYGSMSDCPEGVELRDAREILPEQAIFTYKNGSYAGFSDVFRYTVLCREGGLWSDLDVICLLPANALQAAGRRNFLVSEHRRSGCTYQVNNNLIYWPNPVPGDLLDLARTIAQTFDSQKLNWGDCGPKLLTMLERNYQDIAPDVLEPDFANPIPAKACPRVLLSPGRRLPPNAAFLHCYNERWRRKGFDKNSAWPPTSILGLLEQRFLVNDQTK